MDPSKIRPLETLDFRFRPLAPHAIAWSCDAELAVALDDAIHVFFPEFPALKAGDKRGDDDLLQPQFSLTLEVSGTMRPEPSVNARLCADAGVELPAANPSEGFVFYGVGKGPITEFGAGLGQTVRLEWSPTGLGQNLRPVLTALATNGSVMVMGEHIDTSSTMASSATARSFKNWRLLWGLGALLPIPDETQDSGYRRMNEKIISFSWAQEILPGRALLAYKNDAGDVVILAVQYISCERTRETPEQQDSWRISELVRFDGQGPHKVVDPHDPESMAYSSAFGLKWSPWHVSPLSRTATLAYVANNYIGFRRVTVSGDWTLGNDPTLHIEQSDTTGICMSLGPDAFIEWEDAIWPEGDLGQMARGIIATPFIPKPFQVDLCGGLARPMAPHVTSQCDTTYCPDEDASTNPITGLIVHRPDPDDKPSVPLYSLVRLSATAANREWYQTNTTQLGTDEPSAMPQWAQYALRQAGRKVPRVAAMHGVDSDSDSDALEDEYTLETGPMSRVHPYRIRFWGLASSPGGGCTVALVTKYSTMHQHRRPRSKLLFGWRDPADEAAPTVLLPPTARLTTEGRLWEAVYGGQGRVADVVPTTGASDAASLGHSPSPLRERFEQIIPTQRCVFCDAQMSTYAHEATCENGHSFATCAASGLAIMAPGVSRLCAVCGLRCLKVGELVALSKQHLGDNITVESTGQVCGGCGGKFVT